MAKGGGGMLSFCLWRNKNKNKKMQIKSQLNKNKEYKIVVSIGLIRSHFVRFHAMDFKHFFGLD